MKEIAYLVEIDTEIYEITTALQSESFITACQVVSAFELYEEVQKRGSWHPSSIIRSFRGDVRLCQFYGIREAKRDWRYLFPKKHQQLSIDFNK